MDVRSDKWSPSRSRYLFPARLMSDLFRSEMLPRVARMSDEGQLRFAGRAKKLEDPGTRQRLWRRLWRKKWVVYAKRPASGCELLSVIAITPSKEGPAQVFKYLGRYTHPLPPWRYHGARLGSASPPSPTTGCSTSQLTRSPSRLATAAPRR